MAFSSTYKPILFGLSALAFTACTDPALKAKAASDYCISGGAIHSAKANNNIYEAVAVKDGTISYAGSDENDWCAAHTNGQAVRIDLKGGALYPGFTDSHGHLLGIGLRELTLNLEGTTSVANLQERLAAVVAVTPEGETIYGRGWIETHWPEKRFPSRQDLDSVAPDNPVILERSDGHALVVNSLALDEAGINRQTKAPFGGAINRDDKGQATGMLIDNAKKLVDDLMPELTRERREEAYVKGAELYASRGWTNIHSMSVDPDDIALINRLAQQGKIKIRVYNSLDVFDKQVMARMDNISDIEDPLVTTRAIKLYADGALGSRGAALLLPYSDDSENSGLMLLKDKQFQSVLQAALRSGTQVNTHAIGDKANRQVLDWYQQAFAAVPKSEWGNGQPRWRIEHAQIVDLADIPRYAQLGIIPSMQPSHAIGDLHFAPDRLGPNRLGGAYAWQALIDSGAKIAGGTDAPVEVGDPRIEFYAATQRMDLKGFSNQNWNREQRVSPQNALKMFTTWAAYASFQDKQIGTISVGKEADLSAFDRDFMAVSGEEVLSSKVLFTMVNGEMAYQAKD